METVGMVIAGISAVAAVVSAMFAGLAYRDRKPKKPHATAVHHDPGLMFWVWGLVASGSLIVAALLVSLVLRLASH